jgi:hypothetical protein
MEFHIHKRPLGGEDITRGYNDAWSWTLDLADGTTVAQGPHDFATEKSCRSQIAAAKKSMKGAMRCKVTTLTEPTA